MKGGVETELKYRLSGPEEHARLRARLVERNAVTVGVQTEENMLYSAGQRHPMEPGAALRLRTLDGGPRAIVTFKGPAEFAGGVKSRREVEAAVDDAGDAASLLAALGYTPSLQYRKSRETWRLDDVEVALDTLEFGCFCELEGPAAQIQRLAELLGLHPSQVETRGYGALQEEANAAL